MKKTKISPETPATKVTVEAAVAPKAAAKLTPKKTSAGQAPEKKPKAVAPQVNVEQPRPASVVETAPKKPAAAKPKAKPVKPAAAKPELPMAERVGLTAGTIWHYLSGNGETSVAKLVKELPEEEKIVQRSIGWLALEDKISISIADRIEVVALK
ncbi:MAG: winged helix-turn-helix domain-containing protein [Methylomonas sp.]|uniref:winged helix-turn-helix domain-containing protein n=1 Tax=Methylomonas sp. TaxID=418 RepID=UPI0025D5C881|nr:winged helix-turn-helix domain-containing protein [Methylomonas sp.]MCK9606502.1 winged helix-turn-helix domain-containing protein [Methylomonas sp.]